MTGVNSYANARNSDSHLEFNQLDVPVETVDAYPKSHVISCPETPVQKDIPLSIVSFENLSPFA